METPVPKGKLLVLRLTIILSFIILTAQLWRLQIVSSDEFQEKARRNRFRLVSIPAERGIIYDREGRILVRNKPSFAISILPADLPQEKEDEVLARLATLLDVPLISTHAPRPPRQSGPIAGAILPVSPGSSPGIRDLIQAGRRQPFTPVVLKHNVDREVAFIIEEEHLSLPGVQVQIEPVRQYLEGPLTSHLIGYVGPIPQEALDGYLSHGYSPEDKVGLTGVELTFEQELRGHKGRKHIEVDVAGREIRTVGQPQEAEPGHNLVLTIDLELQRAAQAALLKGLQGVNSPAGVVVAMNPQTGEILAMVSWPSYDNNLFATGISFEDYARLSNDPSRPLVNHAIGGQYPPGSTFKIIPAAAALEEGVVKLNTPVVCPGVILIPNKYAPDDPQLAQPFYCWYRPGHGPLTFVEGIAQSCDIYFYTISGGFGDFVGLGQERLADYARQFGLGERTGLALPGESQGLVPTEKWKRQNYGETWVTGDTYNMAIGQGFVLVTPLQILNATAAVANGGTLYRPQIVHHVTDAEGRLIRDFAPQVIRQIPVSPEHLASVRAGLRAAVTHGTARLINLSGLAVAGKTGTAEYPGRRDKNGHLPTHAWFTAFAPVEDPRLALVVFVEGGGEGSRVAVPIAAEIMRYYFGLPGQ